MCTLSALNKELGEKTWGGKGVGRRRRGRESAVLPRPLPVLRGRRGRGEGGRRDRNLGTGGIHREIFPQTDRAQRGKEQTQDTWPEPHQPSPLPHAWIFPAVSEPIPPPSCQYTLPLALTHPLTFAHTNPLETLWLSPSPSCTLQAPTVSPKAYTLWAPPGNSVSPNSAPGHHPHGCA